MIAWGVVLQAVHDAAFASACCTAACCKRGVCWGLHRVLVGAGCSCSKVQGGADMLLHAWLPCFCCLRCLAAFLCLLYASVQCTWSGRLR
jgi:hypothetical protein